MVAAEDFRAITRPIYEYAYAIDQRDFGLYRSIFTDTVTMDFSSYSGGEPGGRSMAADAWVSRTRPLFEGLDATQHTMTNPLVDIDPTGDSARCRMYMQALHVLVDDPEPEFTIGGFYDDQLVRTAHGWKINAVTLTVWWRRGNFDIMAIARNRGQQRLSHDS